jgi:hypothetical protein
MKHKNKKRRRFGANREITDHHVVNKCRGGQTVPENILHMTREHHCAWHSLFLNMDLDEVIEYLNRVKVLLANKAT